MFHQISRTIALQFTLLVGLLLLLVGALFLSIAYGTQRRQIDGRLEQSAQQLGHRFTLPPNLSRLTPRDTLMVRTLNAGGQVVYSGPFFVQNDVSITDNHLITVVDDQGETYRVVTHPLPASLSPVRYIQVAARQPLGLKEVSREAIIFLLVSTGISVITYAIGLRFAQTSLTPAQEMMVRLHQFTQDASHELRTPLAVLGSTLDVALQNHQYREGIVSAQADLVVATTLVERLLELARLDRYALHLERIDGSALVQEIVEKYRPLAIQAGLRLEIHIEPGVILAVDTDLFRQLLTNLLSNALKFNRPDGQIMVTLTKQCLFVADTGIGIDPEQGSHIFDRFYQVDMSRSEQGLGLGLALVRRIVELHGWQIGLVSIRNKESRFTVSFRHRRS